MKTKLFFVAALAAIMLNSIQKVNAQWLLTGNSVADSNFIGTTNAKPLIFKTNRTERGRILPGGGWKFNGNVNSLGGYSLNSIPFLNNYGIIDNTFVGSAGNNTATGTSLTGVGNGALVANTTGYRNTATGNICLYNNNIGYQNTANGYASLLNNNSGNNNAAYGYYSLLNNTTGTGNTALGAFADVLSGNLTNATAVGYNAKVALSNALVLGNTGANSVNVGIGTTAPALGKFVVEGMVGNTVAVFKNSSATSRGLSLVTDFPGVYFNSYYNGGQKSLSQGYTGIINFDADKGDLYLGTSSAQATSADQVIIAPSRLLIDKNGNVGIGTLTPTFKLDITGNTRFNPLSALTGFIINSNGTDPVFRPAASDFGFLGTDSFHLFRIFSREFFASNTAAYKVYSDSRVKENIKPMSNALSLVSLLRPVTYDLTKQFFYRGGNSRLSESDRTNQLGFIAQEIEKVFPQLVGTDGSGIKTVGYVGLIPVLTEAIQEQQKQIEELKQTVEQLLEKMNSNNTDNSNVQLNTIKSNNGSLQQNIPNPFNNSSSVSYYIPRAFNTASLIITDMSGKTLKAYSITQSGAGKQIITGSQLTGGIYQYSLIVDGKVVDTKKMMLSK